MKKFIIFILFLSLFSFSFAKNNLEILRVISTGKISETGTGSFTQYDKESGKTYSSSSTLTSYPSTEQIYLLQIKYSMDLSSYCSVGVSSGYFETRPDYYFKRSEIEAVPLTLIVNINKKFFHSKLEFGMDVGGGPIIPLYKKHYENINIKSGTILDFGIYGKLKIKSFTVKLYCPSFTSIDFPVKTKPNIIETEDSIITTNDKYDLDISIVSYKLGVGYEF